VTFQPNQRAEHSYASAIWGVFKEFVHEARERGISAVQLSGSDFLSAYAKQAARRMITMLWVGQAKSWQEAASKAGRGSLIYRARQQELAGPTGERVRELVAENAKLISSFPSNVAALVAARAAAQQLGGGRAVELERLEPLLGRLARRRAKLIARTEVSKASSALTQARSEELGLPWYVWQTSQDQRVRLSHRRLQGVLFRFDNPPSPEELAGEKSYGTYNAGATFNCRCYCSPLVSLKEVNWPARVYWGGRIVYMNLGQFKQINNLQLQEAA
jgi:SPP1 gp7 family putative phage head morphogenesis protein